jgi:hypothetical protein
VDGGEQGHFAESGRLHQLAVRRFRGRPTQSPRSGPAVLSPLLSLTLSVLSSSVILSSVLTISNSRRRNY